MVIHVDKDKCINCHACIAVCPVKTCNDGSGAYVNLHANSCIGCGRCLAACTHGARYFTDDFACFMEAVARQEKMVAVVAPSVVSNFPDQYLRLNGWLKSLGVSAVFDVSFGAELCAKSYAAFIRRCSPQVVIAQPCPAIVTYIQVHHPELLQYLAPVDSPMLHTMKMVRRYFPQYADHKIVVISPCPAKKREHVETGYGDYNVTYSSIGKHLLSNEIGPGRFSRGRATKLRRPTRRCCFRSRGVWCKRSNVGCRAWESRREPSRGRMPSIRTWLRCPNMIRKHPATVPLLIDCLNCRHGCNCGPAALASQQEIDAVEYHTEKRHRDLHEQKSKQIGNRDLTVERLLFDYWSEDLYTRQYADLAENNSVRHPSPEEQKAILASMHKYSEQDQYNCCSCGYGTCLDMTVAIFNGLNRPENCHHYLAKEREIAQQQLTEYRDHLEKLVEDSHRRLEGGQRATQQGIVERMRVEEELQGSKQKLRGSLHGSPIAQFVIDKNHKVIYWNKALEQLSGMPAEGDHGHVGPLEGLLRNAADVCLADLARGRPRRPHRVPLRRQVQQVHALDDAYEGIDSFRIGEQGSGCTSRRVPQGRQGNVVGAVETLEDITDRRLAEIQARQVAAGGGSGQPAKSEFLANISHELRTPLHGILSYAKFGLNETTAAEQSELHEFFHNVDHCAHTLLHLVNDLLDLSKLEAGRMSFEFQPCRPGRPR